MKKRISFMDFLAIISSFAVVTLHSAAGNYDFTHFSRSSLTNILIQVVFSFGVPIFFMQSGSNLLNYRERYDTRTFVKKRMHKVIIPFVFWSVIAYLFFHFMNNDISNIRIFDFLNGFLDANIMGPYWFFYNIIAFYAIVPVLSLLIKQINKKQLIYFISISLFANSIFPFLMSNVFKASNGYFFSVFPLIGSYLQYFLVGYLISHYDFKLKVRRIWYTLAICSLAVEIVLTPLITYNLRSFYKPIFDIQNIFAFIAISGMFLFFRNQEKFFSKYSRSLQKISALTFGIYLIHPFIIPFVDQYIGIDSKRILHEAVAPIAVFLVAGLVTYLLRKISFVKRYLIP